MSDTRQTNLSEIILSGLNDVFEKNLSSKNVNIQIKDASKKGDNCVGIVHRITGKVVAQNENEKNIKSSSSVILKVTPSHIARREQFGVRKNFLREILMYNELLPLFYKFQESRGVIPEENGFYEYPVCYKTIETELNESLFLQDLKEEEFEMFDRFKDITVDHVRLVMKTLGKYHALSFAIRDQDWEKLEPFTNLPEIFMREEDESLKMFFDTLTQGVYDSLNNEADSKLLAKVKELFTKNLITIAGDCITGKVAEPYAVICHGDFWNNNTLFKYNEKNIPTDVRFLDWQIFRYASPVTDILNYIFSCTTKELRDEHYEDFLKLYHESLSDMLTRLGSDPEKLFPYDVMQNHLRKFGKYGVVMSTLAIPFATTPIKDFPDLEAMAETMNNDEKLERSVFATDKSLYNKRMRDIIVDMDRLGYI